MPFACFNGPILSDGVFLDDHALIVDNGRIGAIIEQQSLPADLPRVDLQGRHLVPGFVDLQVNGGNGVLFNDAPTVDAIREIARAHWQFGTTSLLPTLISDDLAKIIQATASVQAAIDANIPGVVGIHIEGPFLNVARRGIHDAGKIRQSDREGLDALGSVNNGRMLVTLAPECVSTDHIRELRERGILICAGHSNASYAQMKDAFELGVGGVTHLFNAMSQLGNREPGVVGAALDTPDCWCCIIVDNAHVHPATLRLAIRAKGGPDRFILVTDAMPTVGKREKSFFLNGKQVTVAGGVCQDEFGTLAGSDLNMATAVANARALLNTTLAEAVAMASANPALFLDMLDEFGTLSPGKRANMVALNDDGTVETTWIDGRPVWEREQ